MSVTDRHTDTQMDKQATVISVATCGITFCDVAQNCFEYPHLITIQVLRQNNHYEQYIHLKIIATKPWTLDGLKTLMWRPMLAAASNVI